MPEPLINELTEIGKPDEYVINDSIDALNSLYKRIKIKANFPYNFHALRHYNASIMLQMGIPTTHRRNYWP